MRRLLLVALCSLVAAGAADALLDQAKRNMAERLAAAPDFTCLLEIERAIYPNAASPRFQSRDRSRLEVSVVKGQELFAWPGERFEERPLTDFLGPGLASTGEFSMHGRTVFADARAWIERSSQQERPGHTIYDYEVAAEVSRYALSVGDDPLVTAYQGVFHVDESTQQVVRLEVRVPQPPSGSGLARVATAIDYRPTRLGDSEALLPAEAVIEVESAQGPVARNRLGFGSCRSYQTDAAMRFSGENAVETDRPNSAEPISIPAGLELPLELRDPISSERAWAGDPFTATVYKNVKADGETLLPKGAQVRGRVVRLETIDTTPSVAPKDRVRLMTAISLQLAGARWEGRCAPLSATLRLVERIPQMSRVYPSGDADYVSTMVVTSNAATYDSTSEMSDPGSGTFIVHGELYLVREGTRMRWTTAASSGECVDGGGLMGSQ